MFTEDAYFKMDVRYKNYKKSKRVSIHRRRSLPNLTQFKLKNE